MRLSRRQFLYTGVMAAVVAVVPLGRLMADDAASKRVLRVIDRTIDINGRAAKVYGLVDAQGRAGLVLKKGEAFRVQLKNESAEPTLIHWHGMTPPWKQDGVPDVTQPLLPAGESYAYDFAPRTGTHWMHAHTLQEQRLLAAPLIVKEDEHADVQDVVVLLHDFSFRAPEEILAGLQKSMDHDMDHMSMDVNDINHDAYLANDRTLRDPEIVQVEKGGRVRLRIINGATSTGFMVDLGSLAGVLEAVDGNAVKPVRGRRFPISMGQRLDIIVQLPGQGGAWPVLAQREGAYEQTGIVLATAKAVITKIVEKQKSKGEILGWSLEKKLRAGTPLSVKKPDAVFSVTLGGGMMPYQWDMGIADHMKGGLFIKSGQRIHITLQNETGMAHPIHLHGHHFQVVALNGKPVSGAVRDTLLVPDGMQATLAFDADNPGKWAFHCHNLYHMAAGMMGFVTYEGLS